MHTGNHIKFSNVSKECCFNVSTLSDPNLFHLSIYLSPYSISNLNSDSNSMFPLITTLVDSGSSYCFIDLTYITLHKLLTVPTLHPILLCFFNGLLDQTITQIITEFSIYFPSENILSLTFHITSLNSSCFMVLGYS